MKFTTTLLTLLFVFLTPAIPLLIMTGLAIGIDTIYGIYCAKKQGRFKSKRASDVVGKLGLYEAVILLLYIMDYFIINSILIDFIGIEFIATKILSVFFCYLEFESISETYKRLHGVSLKSKFISAFGNIRDGLNSLRDLSKRDNK
jgi:hypothetical protein